MNKYYECHITMKGDPKELKPLVESHKKWKFSAIDGDPVLGDGVLCYATRHYSYSIYPIEGVIAAMHLVADQLPDVIREKVELVVYDTKKVAA